MSDSVQNATAVDARREARHNVFWKALLKLPNGSTIEVVVKDISESGMGLVVNQPVPKGALLSIILRVPNPANPEQMLAGSGTVKVVYAAMQGDQFGVGAIWVERSEPVRLLLARWLRKLHFGT